MIEKIIHNLRDRTLTENKTTVNQFISDILSNEEIIIYVFFRLC